jgi:hypothetical protein
MVSYPFTGATPSRQADGVLPFYRGYAFEALARASGVAGEAEEMEKFLTLAHQVADSLPDPQAKEQLLKDLTTIR